MKPTIQQAIELVDAIYARPDGGVGCCLHIATDDGNIADSHIDFCVDCAKERGHADCLEAATALRQLSRTQRHQVNVRRHRWQGGH